VFLDITRLDISLAARSMGLTASSLSSAARVEEAFRALDGGAQASASAEFLQAAGALQRTQGTGAAERSLASLSGELHAADAALALLATDDSRRELEARIDMPRSSSAWGAN